MRLSPRTLAGALCLCAFVSLPARSDLYPAKAPAGEFVVDEAGLLSAEDVQEINRTAAALKAESGVALYVVTIPSLESHGAQTLNLEAYSLGVLIEQVSLESAGGLEMLLLVARDDRKARIQLGMKWNSAFDREAESIMSGVLVPKFKAGDFAGGVRAGVAALAEMGRSRASRAAERPSFQWRSLLGSNIWLWAAGFGLLLLMGRDLAANGQNGLASSILSALGAILTIPMAILFSCLNACCHGHSRYGYGHHHHGHGHFHGGGGGFFGRGGSHGHSSGGGGGHSGGGRPSSGGGATGSW